MLTRQELEAREKRELAPYAMRSAESKGRRFDEPAPAIRTSYQRDRDRIIHSTAFRRLEYKTQVFVNHEGDHYRTRLTHTMEVAQVARTIARALNVNEDLTEAVALAHDVGHTPFGHSGEDALRELMKEHGGFEHNLHGLRVVDHLERLYPEFRGLNLTYEVREAIAKHSTAYDCPQVREFQPDLPPTLEAQIVEAADSIAYNSHDIDDGLMSGLLRDEDLLRLRLPARAMKLAEDEIKRDPSGASRPEITDRLRCRQLVRHLINLVVNDLVHATDARLRELDPKSPEDVRRAPGRIVAFSAKLGEEKRELEEYLQENFYQHYRVQRMSLKAKRFIREIFAAYLQDVRQLPPDYQKRAAREGLHQTLCDYIAGMTDRYVQEEYLKLFEPFEKV